MKLLRIGDKGDAVVYLQQRLNKHGHHVTEDGDFGPKTRDAVLQFQAANGLSADGVVGDKTWAALRVEGHAPAPADLNRESAAWLQDMAKKALKGEDFSKERLRAIVYAAEYLGAEEYPSGKNRGPEIDDLVQGYMEHWQWGDKSKYPAWCGISVSVWMARGVLNERLAGKDIDWKGVPLGNWYGGVAGMEDVAKDLGCFIPDGNDDVVAPAGSIYTMARGNSGSDPATSMTSGHTGIVVADGSFSGEPDYVYTIDGNVSDSVQWKRRKKSVIRGYIAWWELL